jgi:hypothetical protein
LETPEKRLGNWSFKLFRQPRLAGLNGVSENLSGVMIELPSVISSQLDQLEMETSMIQSSGFQPMGHDPNLGHGLERLGHKSRVGHFRSRTTFLGHFGSRCPQLTVHV